MKLLNHGAVAGLALLLTVSASAEEMSLDTDEQKLSYAVGFSIAQFVAQQFGSDITEMDKNLVAAAIGDVLKEQELAGIRSVLHEMIVNCAMNTYC